MKKQFLMLIASAALVLTSCSSELTKEELNDIYIEKAQKYFDGQVEKDIKDGKETDLLNVKVLKVDSISILTKQELEMINYNRHYQLFDLEYNSFKEYEAIDPNLEFELTRNKFNEVKKMQDNLNSYLERIKKMDNKKSIAKSIRFNLKFNFKDGSTQKVEMYCYFNKENEIEKEYMDYIFGDLKPME